MKFEVRTREQLRMWLKSTGPAVVQYPDLVEYDAEIAARDLSGCAFLGCAMGPTLCLLYTSPSPRDS